MDCTHWLNEEPHSCRVTIDDDGSFRLKFWKADKYSGGTLSILITGDLAEILKNRLSVKLERKSEVAK